MKPEVIEEFRRRIITWYLNHGDINLPWRQTEDPWAILLAAFLLRKTTTEQVLKVYHNLLKRYPTPADLARASVDEIKEIIRPLGIENQRSEHLKKLAVYIVEKFNGKIPCNREALMKLPGVGMYIASEILLGACRKPEALLDRNMIRVIERVFGIRSKKKRPHTDKELWALAKSLVPKESIEEAKAFNYGILDFARRVCTARRPKCSTCPLKDICCYQKGITRINQRACSDKRSRF